MYLQNKHRLQFYCYEIYVIYIKHLLKISSEYIQSLSFYKYYIWLVEFMRLSFRFSRKGRGGLPSYIPNFNISFVIVKFAIFNFAFCFSFYFLFQFCTMLVSLLFCVQAHNAIIFLII